MGTIDIDLSAFEDPAPPDANEQEPNEASNGPQHDDVSMDPTVVRKKRKLPFRAEFAVDGKKYKGRRVSRSDAELDRATLGLDKGKLVDASDSELDGVDSTGSVENAVSFASDDNQNEEAADVARDTDVEEKDIREQQLKKEERAVAARLAAAEQKEASRAQAVKKQKDLYDAVVDFRIRLEPLLAVARSFPSVGQRKDLGDWQETDELQEMVAVAESSTTILSNCASHAWKASWCSNDAEEEVGDTAFEEWRNSVLDLWGKKVNEASGVVPAGGFKILDTSVTAQVKASLHSGKHLERTRRMRNGLSLVGGNGETLEGSNEMHYDDGEFYRTLLREIIESGEGAGGGLRYAQLSKAGKVKKKADRSGSKGRRLRYDIHEKLVGFLAPVPLPDAGPLDEIIAGLFGASSGAPAL